MVFVLGDDGGRDLALDGSWGREPRAGWWRRQKGYIGLRCPIQLYLTLKIATRRQQVPCVIRVQCAQARRAHAAHLFLMLRWPGWSGHDAHNGGRTSG